MSIRAIFCAAKIKDAAPPYDTVHGRIYYRASDSPDAADANTVIIAPDPSGPPQPVLIWFNGVNVGPECYTWLARHLGEQGIVTVTFSFVDEIFPGNVALSPGIDVAALTPEHYGSRPPVKTLAPLLDVLAANQESGPLAGRLDLSQVALGGHSAGGAMALESVHTKYDSRVRAAVSYAGHTEAAAMLGHAPGTFLPISSEHPVLIMGGSHDEVIAASRSRYRAASQRPQQTATQEPSDPVERTFAKAIVGDRGDRYLIIVDGGTHATPVHPSDPTTGRLFLENQPNDSNQDDNRTFVAETIARFIKAHVVGDPAAKKELTLLRETRKPPIAKIEVR